MIICLTFLTNIINLSGIPDNWIFAEFNVILGCELNAPLADMFPFPRAGIFTNSPVVLYTGNYDGTTLPDGNNSLTCGVKD